MTYTQNLTYYRHTGVILSILVHTILSDLFYNTLATLSSDGGISCPVIQITQKPRSKIQVLWPSSDICLTHQTTRTKRNRQKVKSSEYLTVQW